MNTRTLGRTGFRVTEIGLGAWPIGGTGDRAIHYGEVFEADALECLRAYVSAGGNFIDTAHAYNMSERRIGIFLEREKVRDKLVITTKTHSNDEAGIRFQLEESLRELKCDVIDLYYLHNPPEDPDKMNYVLDIYERLKNEGKIRAVGASVKGVNVTPGTVELCRRYIRSGRVDVVQVVYSILRQANGEIFQEAREADVGIVARTALESGFLSGRYAPGSKFTGRDHRARFQPDRLAAILDEVVKLRDAVVSPPYESLAQVALRFVLDEPAVDTVIVGASKALQVQRNMEIASLPPLPSEVRRSLLDSYASRTLEFNTVV
jgi:aryl-alcohol dehydrogenase-like predicted oxidoreductase